MAITVIKGKSGPMHQVLMDFMAGRLSDKIQVNLLVIKIL